jgi:hypothetical protein
MKIYDASLGNLSKIITACVILIMVVGFISISWRSSIEPRREYSFVAAFILLMMMLPIITFFYRPKSYSIDSESFQVNRLAGSFRIPISVIQNVFIAQKEEMKLPIRIFGNGGVFGFTGYYRNSRFGSMRWFVTQRQNYVLIETVDGSKYVITPNDPKELVDELNKKI